MAVQRLLITGAAGLMGGLLRPLLRRERRAVRLADVRDMGTPLAGEEPVFVDVTDYAAVALACRDVDAVLHLGGIGGEAPFDELAAVNVVGTRNVLQAAVACGVGRVILASSNHAAGFYRRADVPAGGDGLPDDLPPRPDTFYGWSKAAGEALGALYRDRYGIDVVALRIGTCRPEPTDARALATWLAPVDAARLVEACLAAPSPGFQVVWAVSDNTRRWWSLAGATALGYRSVKDAERWAPSLTETEVEPSIDDRVGGAFCTHPLGLATDSANPRFARSDRL
ncbi:MAG: NAD-dependent epimerase/dehydratase family protein [Angustibacter sp.]